MFQSMKEMSDAVKPAATVLSDRVSVTSPGAVSGDLVDNLAWTAVFGADAELRGAARWIVRSLAAASGVRPASIHDLYLAMGRGAVGGFTVPAINVRAMTYDTARAVVRSAKALNAGAFIFEIARSEIGYTEQRPHGTMLQVFENQFVGQVISTRLTCKRRPGVAGRATARASRCARIPHCGTSFRARNKCTRRPREFPAYSC